MLTEIADYQVQNASTNSTSPDTTNNNSSSTPVGAIAGGVVGGVVGLALVCLAGWLWLRRRRQQQRQPVPTEEPYPEDHKPPYTEPEPAAPTHEVEGGFYNKSAPAELSSHTDAIAELPGHGAESRSERGRDGRDERYDTFHDVSDETR